MDESNEAANSRGLEAGRLLAQLRTLWYCYGQGLRGGLARSHIVALRRHWITEPTAEEMDFLMREMAKTGYPLPRGTLPPLRAPMATPAPFRR